ncbi:MAG: hypothetical protein KDK10_02595 [Maritimibacter sp.]|nr:hypothetical protein [Maritimibacter sp.]
MFGIMASVFRDATRNGASAGDDYHDWRRHPGNRREEERRRAEAALEELKRYRRGFW